MIQIKLFLIVATSVCDNHCRFCVSDHLNKQDQLPTDNKYIDLVQICSVINKYGISPDDVVYFTGGEPTLHPELEQLVQYVSNYTNNIGLLTNGNRLANMYYLKGLIKSGLTSVLIPIYGYDEKTHDYVTQKNGSFSDVMTAIENIVEIKKYTTITLRIRFVISRSTFHYISRICTNLKSISTVDEVIFSYIHPSKIAVSNDELVPIMEFKDEFNCALQMLFDRIGCQCSLRLLPQKDLVELLDKSKRLQYYVRQRMLNNSVPCLDTADESIRIDLNPANSEIEYYDLINN